MEKQYFLNYVRYSAYFKPEKVCYTSNRHENSLRIDDSYVTRFNEDTFIIKSSNNQDEFYIVHKVDEQYFLNSCLKCNNLPCCNLCEHLYTCSCFDRDTLCKHVHKVHGMCDTFNNIDDEDNFFELTHSETLCNKPSTNDRLVVKFQTALKEIDSYVNNHNMNSESLENGIITLDKLITSLKANSNLQTKEESKSINPVLKVSANQNFEKQPNFKKTKKTHKKTNNLKAPTNRERQQLISSCINEDLPTVADYPPMEYVSDNRQYIDIHDNRNLNDPFINPSGGVYLNSNFLIPPDVENQNIQVTKPDGKKIVIQFGSSKHKMTSKDNDEDL